MANPTSNFGWQMPTNTDLVKDLPADFETFGQAVDSDLADLKGGTTGQVLSKNSDTDMDFAWVTSDDANAIQNAIVDAKGDLITATAADTPARLAVGNDGETIVADSAATTGLRWQGNYAAGKNKIINGDFGIWQRGTSFTIPNNNYTFTTDRLLAWFNGSSNGTNTVSRESFTPGTAPVAGYESQYFLRWTVTALGTSQTVTDILQKIEDVRTFAGQTITVSFWVKSSGTQTLIVYASQDFGSGGSTQVDTSSSVSAAMSASWQRVTATISVPSISGKTIGTGSNLAIRIRLATPTTGQTWDIWGLQVEAGNVATAFQTATGTIQGELAACQRYLPSIGGSFVSVFGYSYSTTGSLVNIEFPVTARVKPTGITLSSTAHFTLYNGSTASGSPTTIAYDGGSSVSNGMLLITTTAGSPTLTAGQGALLQANTASGLILWTGCEL